MRGKLKQDTDSCRLSTVSNTNMSGTRCLLARSLARARRMGTGVLITCHIGKCSKISIASLLHQGQQLIAIPSVLTTLRIGNFPLLLLSSTWSTGLPTYSKHFWQQPQDIHLSQVVDVPLLVTTSYCRTLHVSCYSISSMG